LEKAGIYRDYVAWIDFLKTDGWDNGTDKSVPFQSLGLIATSSRGLISKNGWMLSQG
jgi:hypothetical protein